MPQANLSPSPARYHGQMICKVQIGDEVFQTGDGILKSCSVSLAENERSSNCRFVLFDKGFAIADRYVAQSILQGGILGLPEDEEAKTAAVSTAKSSDTASLNISNNMRAFLDVISYAEGTQKHGYRTLFGGSTFESFVDHPNKVIDGGNIKSSAAGRYQIMDYTWFGKNGAPGLKKRFGYKDFSPQSQDAAAIELIRGRGAYDLIEQGKISEAFNKLNREWASFPGSPYGQPIKSAKELLEYWKLKKEQYDGDNSSTATEDKAVGSESKVEAPIQAIQRKGCPIVVSLSFGAESYDFGFIHVSTQVSFNAGLQTTAFTGQSVRWLLTRRLKSTAYKDISLKKLGEKIAASYSLKFKWEDTGEGPKYTYLDQSGITDYQLLLRECEKAGYRLHDDAKSRTLTISARQSPTSSYVLRLGENIRNWTITDTAQKDETSNTASDGDDQGITGEVKTQIDPLTGQLVQIAPENKVATGNAQSGTKFATGATKEKLGGVYSNETDPTVVTARRDAAKRTKGIQGQCSLTCSTALLATTPHTFLATEGEGFPGSLSRSWLIESIRHSYPEQQTDITFYSPGRPKKESNESAADSLGSGVNTGTEAPITEDSGTFIQPIAGAVAIGDGVGYISARGRNHHGVDVDAPDSTAILASASGVVVKVVNSCHPTNSRGCGGGYGNQVILAHKVGGKNYTTLYAHLSRATVSVGRTVKQGEKIGELGNSGSSDGSHLHFEIRDSTNTSVPPGSVGVKWSKRLDYGRGGKI